MQQTESADRQRGLARRSAAGKIVLSHTARPGVLPVSEPIVAPTNVDPLRNPSYPQRVHIRERAQWATILSDWDAKIATARARGGTGAESAKRSAQMSGARDQIADAAKRLPMEVGEMYAEDRHKLEEAVAALERLIAKV